MPTQVGYASAELGLNAVETCLRLYLLIYYTDVLGLRPALAGTAVAIGLLFDAVTDPLAGAISDRTRHLWGGRARWILIGSVVLAIGFLAVFSPPRLGDQGPLFAWLLGSYVLLNVGLTMISVPHTALAGELSADRHQRTALMGWRFALANGGAVMAAALPVALSGTSVTSVAGISAMPEVAGIIAVVVVTTGITTWAATRRACTAATATPRRPLGESLLRPLRNRVFRPLLLGGVLATLGIGMNAATALYYYGYRLALSDRQIQTMLVVFIGVFTLSIPAWVAISRRKGKLGPLVAGACTLGVATTVIYLLLPRGVFVWPLVIGAIGLGSLVGCIVLIDSLITDIVDLDRLVTGRQASGAYFGVWKLAQKVARALALGIVGWVLDLSGFVPGGPQPPSTDAALAVLFGPCVGGCFLGAGLILTRFRHDDARQARVQALLERRAGRAAAPGRPRGAPPDRG